MGAIRSQDVSGTQEAILDAAEATFARLGYEGATFSDICTAAGVSRGLPSYLFGSKEGLYKQVVQRAAQHLRDAMIEPLRACAETATASEGLSLMVGTYVDYLGAHPRIVRLLQWEMLSEPSESRPFAPSSVLFSEILNILRKMLAKNRRRDVNARALLGSVVALCFFPSMVGARIEGLGKFSLGERKRHIISLVTRGL